MNICETFELPGQSSPNEVIANLAQVPRTLTLVGCKSEIAVRVLCYLLCLAFAAIVIVRLGEYYIDKADIFAWFVILLIVPLVVIGLPWCLGVGLKRRHHTFERCRAVYEQGEPAIARIVMMSYVSGNDYACFFSDEQFRPSVFARRVRIDYTFSVNNELKHGSVFIREKNARLITVDDEVCVLYDPDDPDKNMLFPLPGEEMCSFCLK